MSTPRKLGDVAESIGEVSTQVDVSAGVIQHLIGRTRQYQELDRVDMFGTSLEAKESRKPAKGDHPLVQVLKQSCNEYAANLEVKAQYRNAVDNELPTKESYRKSLMSPNQEVSCMKRICEIAEKVSKMADGHFAREVDMWLQFSKQVQARELSIEEAAKALAKQEQIDYATAFNILSAQADTDAA